jgi:hypothetical protein
MMLRGLMRWVMGQSAENLAGSVYLTVVTYHQYLMISNLLKCAVQKPFPNNCLINFPETRDRTISITSDRWSHQMEFEVLGLFS